MKISKFPFHSILISIYPIINLYARNVVYIPFQNTIRFLIFSIAIFGLFLLGFQAILRDRRRAGILCSLLAFLFFSFGHVASLLEKWFSRQGLEFNISVLAWVWLFLFLLFTFFIVRFQLPKNATHFFNLFSLFLIIFPIVTIVSTFDVNSETNRQDRKTLAHLRGEIDAEASLQQVPSSQKPDIYYIIFDGYERADLLKELYGYDNASFLEALEQRGFYIVSSSRSNYLNTNYSLNTSLNLMYFHQFPKKIFNRAKYNLLTNYVNDFLHEQGYKIVVFDSGTGDTNSQKADIFIRPNSTKSSRNSIVNTFERLLLRTTMGVLLFHDHSTESSENPNDMVVSSINRDLSMRRERIEHAVDHLPDYASRDGHYYLFSHIYLPHIPFLYGPDGEAIKYHENLNLYWYEVEPEDYVEYYIYQIEYLNKRILNTIDAIMTESKKPVVIILQSDHGDERFLDRDAPTTLGVDARSAILNAIYFSDGSYYAFYPTMTPVNTFRIVFNHWFGTSYSILPDKVYFHEHSVKTRPNEKPAFLDSCANFDVCLPEYSK
jgi:hypothetical protein